jgi:hypothetical protein
MATGTRMQAEDPEIENLPLEEQIRRRAYEIWVEKGRLAGTDLIDWLDAEQEILNKQER